MGTSTVVSMVALKAASKVDKTVGKKVFEQLSIVKLVVWKVDLLVETLAAWKVDNLGRNKVVGLGDLKVVELAVQ